MSYLCSSLYPEGVDSLIDQKQRLEPILGLDMKCDVALRSLGGCHDEDDAQEAGDERDEDEVRGDEAQAQAAHDEAQT